jgi:DNA-directed RNA polymerase specialized sigma24 family protein
MERVKEEMPGTESLVNILSDRAHNSKWINFARKELRGNKKSVNARYKEAEDYVEDVKLKILSGEIVLVEGNGDADNFICGIIKNEINTELRKWPVMVVLLDRENHDDEAEDGEPGNEVGAEANLVVNFDDPFENKENEIDPKDLMKICYELLEKEEPELLIIFDEKAKGHPNREIAKYLHVEVSEIEKIWKRILRLLRRELL